MGRDKIMSQYSGADPWGGGGGSWSHNTDRIHICNHRYQYNECYNPKN